MRFSTRLALFSALLAGALPAASAAAQADAFSPPPAEGGVCKAPLAGEPPLVEPRIDFGPMAARLREEAGRAGDEGIRPLNVRGHNYATGPQGLSPAALRYETP